MRCANSGYCTATPKDAENLAEFEAFEAKHAKVWSSTEQRAEKLATFSANLEIYAERNENEPHATFGWNQFSDLTAEEFITQRAGWTKYESTGTTEYSAEQMAAFQKELAATTDTIDWRDDKHKAVTPAKDQGAFGDCWSFGASAVVEGINVAQANKTLVSLCEQEFIDCCAPCNGAGPGLSWNWLINNTHGFLDTEASYPYKGDKPTGECRPKTAEVSDFKVGSWKIINEDAKTHNQDAFLLEMIKGGPCNIGVDASCLSGYQDGVITNCTGKDVDHANVIVGSGTMPDSEEAVKYWIVKNSWSDKWGEEGFYKVARNTQQMKIDACWHAYVSDDATLPQ